MIRILQCVNDMHRAGLETMLMNYYRHMDRDEIQFDFLTHRPYRSDYDDEIESMGGHVYYAPRLYPKNYIAYFKWMKQFFKEHPEYKIMHSHIDSMSYLPLLAAKLSGVPVRIAHSHNTSIDRDFKFILKQIFRVLITTVTTKHLACGQEAGRYLFGKKDFQVIPNAVEADRFLYNEETRLRKRHELGIGDTFVVGHVGRISYQKNHDFLLDIFAEIIKLHPDSLLLLVGVGEKEPAVREKIKKLGLEEKVCFLGNRSDVNELYQAMDVFILPSFFEGVPVVGVEAQFADLPCLFSDKTPREVQFNSKSRFISLQTEAKEWAQIAVSACGHERTAQKEELKNSVFDIENSYGKLAEYYKQLI